jgi:hypothetical protein
MARDTAISPNFEVFFKPYINDNKNGLARVQTQNAEISPAMTRLLPSGHSDLLAHADNFG